MTLAHFLQQFFNSSFHLVQIIRGLETGHHIALPVHQELGEIPLDIRGVLVIRGLDLQLLLQEIRILIILKTVEALLSL